MATASLIMTVHNRERFLTQAIESVLAQKFTDFELLIWDDGSTDRSLDIARQYQENDRRIHVTQAPKLGRAWSLRLAHDIAKGEYVGWIDSDDTLEPMALASAIEALGASPEVNMVYTNYWVMNEQGERQEVGRKAKIPYSPRRMLVDFMTFHFRLMRREAYRSTGGIDISFPCAMDYDLCLKISELEGSIVHLPICLYNYRVHSESISQQQKELQVRSSERAVRNALMRRGLNNQLQLSVKNGNFHLRSIQGKP